MDAYEISQQARRAAVKTSRDYNAVLGTQQEVFRVGDKNFYEKYYLKPRAWQGVNYKDGDWTTDRDESLFSIGSSGNLLIREPGVYRTTVYANAIDTVGGPGDNTTQRAPGFIGGITNPAGTFINEARCVNFAGVGQTGASTVNFIINTQPDTEVLIYYFLVSALETQDDITLSIQVAIEYIAPLTAGYVIAPGL